MDGGAWWATVHGVAKSWARLSDFTYLLTYTGPEPQKQDLAIAVPLNYMDESTASKYEVSKNIG